MLPMVEILKLAKQGAGELMREVRIAIDLLAMAQDVEALTGTRYHLNYARLPTACWSTET